MQQHLRAKSLAVSLRDYGVPLVVTAIIGTLLLVTLNFNIYPYKVEVIRQQSALSGESLGMLDFDGDGISELVFCSNEKIDGSKNGCVVRRISPFGELSAIDQYNIDGKLIGNHTQAIAIDYNQDGIDELGVVYHRGDSLFFAVFHKESDRAFLNIYLDSVGLDNGEAIMSFKKIGEYDRNGDGYLETYFYLGSHYGLYPRRVYSIDIVKESFIASPQASVGFVPDIFDTPETKEPQIVLTGSCQMPNNFDPFVDLIYPDNKGYSYAFNPDLSWKIEPKEEIDYPGNIFNFVRNDTLVSICTMPHPDSANQVRYRSLIDGRFLGTKKLPWNYRSWRVFRDELLVSLKDSLLIYDKHLRLLRVLKKDAPFATEAGVRNLWSDKSDGVICYYYSDKKLVFYNNKLEKKAQIQPYNTLFKSTIKEALAIHHRGSKIVTLNTGNFIHQFKISPDPNYSWRWFIWLGIFVLSGSLVFGLFGIFKRNIELHHLREKRMNELQAISLKKQIDSHFVLNTLNNIDWMYRNNEWKQANNIMSRLSRLMQKSVRQNTKLTANLVDELEFCRDYCAIEKSRSNQFKYFFTIGDNVDPKDIMIPQQLIFTHVENAIKHGIRPKLSGKKELHIEIEDKDKNIIISIFDTGLGMSSHSKTSGTRKGLKILNEIIDLHRQIYGIEIGMVFTDFENHGTKVLLTLPKTYSEV